jgi:uncharacterized protein (TIGR02099 family)
MLVRRVLRFSWWVVAATVVALAVALSAARLLLPGMSDYKAQVEALAGDVLGRSVTVGSLDAAWRGLSPVLKLQTVVIKDERFPGGALAIDEVHVALDVIDSVANRQWLTAGIRLIGIELALETDLLNGEWGGQALESLAWILGQESITLDGVRLAWSDPGLFDDAMELQELSVQLVNEDKRHQFLLQARLPHAAGQRVKIAADVEGGSAEVLDWTGRVYLKTENLDLHAVDRIFAQSVGDTQGRVDLELWAGLQGRRMDWGSGSISVRDLQFGGAIPGKAPVQADLLSSIFHWQATGSGWQVELREFSLQRDGRNVWPASDARLNIGTDNALNIQGRGTLFVLSELQPVLPLLPWIDDKALAMVDRLQPKGRLRDADFEFRYAQGKPPVFSVRAKIEDLQVAASGGLPGVTGLSGTIEGNLQAGFLYLDSSTATLSLATLFPSDLTFSQLSGVVQWKRYQDMFRVEAESLRIESDALSLVTRWRLDWPYERYSPWLDLQLALDQLPLTEVRKYLPAGSMSPKAVAWLNRAFVSGTATNARLLFQGQLDQAPFDNHEGRLEARFDFQDVTLAYHPLWGELNNLEGSALFAGRSMEITGSSATIADSPVERVVTVIKDLQRPMLEVSGTIGGTLAGMLGYVETSPLAENFGRLVEQIDTVGEATLQLDLKIPLVENLGRISVDGAVTLEGNQLLPRGSAIAITDIHGTVNFTRSGVGAKGMRAKLFGQPVTVAIYRKGTPERGKTVVEIGGKLKLLETLKKDRPFLAPYLDGSAQWQALVHLPPQRPASGREVMVQLRSDLKGVASSLPAPLNKPMDAPRDLLIEWSPGQEARQPLRISYAGLVDAQVLLTPDHRGVSKAHVSFGGQTARLPTHNIVHLSGRLEQVDAGKWLSIFKPGQNGVFRLAPFTTDLAVDELVFGGVQVNGVEVASKLPDPWYFAIEGEQASGWLRWIAAEAVGPARVLANLQRLALESTKEKPASEKRSLLRPDGLPDLDLAIGALSWGARNLGNIKVVGKRSRNGMEFETLDMASEAIVLKGRGSWLDRESRQSTSFNATIEGGELSELVKLLGNPDSVQGGTLGGAMRLNWPGSPAEFGFAGMEGDVDLRIAEGRLTSVSEGGAVKLLNLFSLNSLQRRLSLDFSDVFKEGFSFNSMQGKFVVMEGDVFTDNFEIEGASAHIKITGRTGLIARDYDQLVTVTPRVSSTLPIAGAIAGGPAVGAAVFLADKLIGDKVNRITRVKYHVTGSWDDPQYEKFIKKNNKNDAGLQGEER